MSDQRVLEPTEPISADTYNEALTDIATALPYIDVVQRALCDLHGDDWFPEAVEPEPEWGDEAQRAVAALVLAGLINIDSDR